MKATTRITKEFHFSASHQLDYLPEGHQCARMHGHNYIVVLELTGPVKEHTGFVLDFGELATFKHWIDTHLDHRHLNDVLGSGMATTAENLAEYLFMVARALYGTVVSGVSVSETPKTWATYRQED